jgi:predicted histidine transporter YuiF (NhaC family)
MAVLAAGLAAGFATGFTFVTGFATGLDAALGCALTGALTVTFAGAVARTGFSALVVTVVIVKVPFFKRYIQFISINEFCQIN